MYVICRLFYIIVFYFRYIYCISKLIVFVFNKKNLSNVIFLVEDMDNFLNKYLE